MALYKIPSAPAARRYPANLTQLSVSWFQGHVEAVAVHRGEVSGKWIFPGAIDDLDRFGEVVREAATRTQYQGSTVSVVLGHPKMAHQLLETPPARGHALASLIEGQISRLKVFEGGAAWSYEPIDSGRNQQLSLVHLFPRTLLDALIRSTERAGLHLVALLPATAVLRGQLARIPGDEKETVLLLAETGELLTVLVGRRTGEILLVRSLDRGPDLTPDRLGVDVNRTQMFVNQQFGAAVGSVWLFGEENPERLAGLQRQLQVPVRQCPTQPEPLFWAEEAARLPAERNLNLVTSEQRKAPQRKTILRVTTVITLALALCAAATLTILQRLNRRELAAIQTLNREIARLQVEHQESQRVHAELTDREGLATALLDGRLEPVPAWFLAYLGELVTPEVRLTDVQVRRDGTLWHVRLEGIPQASTTNAVAQRAFTNSIATLSTRLRTGPFRVALASSTNAPATVAASGAAANVASWVSRRAAAAGPTREQFVLEGWMK